MPETLNIFCRLNICSKESFAIIQVNHRISVVANSARENGDNSCSSRIITNYCEYTLPSINELSGPIICMDADAS